MTIALLLSSIRSNAALSLGTVWWQELCVGGGFVALHGFRSFVMEVVVVGGGGGLHGDDDDDDDDGMSNHNSHTHRTSSSPAYRASQFYIRRRCTRGHWCGHCVLESGG